MTQHIYNEQDNQQLNDSIEQKARGMDSPINHVDELAFYKEDKEPKVSQKLKNSSLSGAFASPAKPFISDSVNMDKALDVINPETGAPHQFSMTPEMIRNAQAQLSDGGAMVFNGNGATGTDLFANIKNMFTNNTPTPGATIKYFTSGKSKVQFGLDKTIFEPHVVVRLSGKSFEKNYLQQLEGYIYNAKEELDPNNLFAIIYLMGFIKDGKFPIKLNSNKHRLQLVKITNTLNVFINKNYSVLVGISNMFNGMTSMPPQAEQKAE